MADGWSFTPPQNVTTPVVSNGWSFTPPSAPKSPEEIAAQITAATPSMAPVRDETPTTIMDGGQQVTVPAWSLGQPQAQPQDSPNPSANRRFDFMTDTANLRPTGPDPFDLTPEQKAMLGGNLPGTPSSLLVNYGLSPITQVVNRLQTGLMDTINIAGRAITGRDQNAQGNGQSTAENLMDYLPGLGLEATHIPESYFTPAVKADIASKIAKGDVEGIMADHPTLNRAAVEANVQAVKQGYKGPISFDDHIPDELSGKRPEVHPPVKPTVDTTHVDAIRETDETGSYHPINVRDPNTGEVTSAGRAYVNPDTGASEGSVLAHPLTKENHTVTPETQALIESKLPGREGAISPALQPTTVEDIKQPGFVSTPNPDPGRPSHTFTYETPDGKVVKGSYDVEGNTIHSVDIGDKQNPVNLGTGEVLNLGKQLAAAHPEVDTIEGLRLSGANRDRTVTVNAQALRDRGQPSVAPNPTVGIEAAPKQVSDRRTGGRAEGGPQEAALEASVSRTRKSINDVNDLVNNHIDDPEYLVQKNSGDIDRARARVVDKFFHELPEDTQEHLRSQNAFDQETGETVPGYDRITGTHMINLFEKGRLEDEQYAGNVNKDRMLDENGQSIPEGVRDQLDEASKAGPGPTPVTNDETRGKSWQLIARHGEDRLLSTDAFKDFEHHDDLAAWPVAVRNIIDKRAIDLHRTIQSAGDATLTQEQADNLSARKNALTDAVMKGMDIIALPGRMLQTGNIEATPTELSASKWAEIKESAKNAIIESGGDPDVIDSVMKNAKTPEGRGLLSQTWFASLLSNWQTHFRYLEGLGLQNVLDIAHNTIGSAIDQPSRFIGDGDFNRIYGREVAARIHGSLSGAYSALQSAGESLARIPGRMIGDGRGQGLGLREAYEGAIGVPTSILGTIGDISKQAGTQGELYAAAMRQAIKESPVSANSSALDTIKRALTDKTSKGISLGGNDPADLPNGNDVMNRYQELLANPTDGLKNQAHRHGDMLSFEDEPSRIAKGFINIQNQLDRAANDPNNPLWTRGPAMAASTTARLLMPFAGRADAVIRSGIRNSVLGLVPGMDRYNTALMIKSSSGDNAASSLMKAKAAVALGTTGLIVQRMLSNPNSFIGSAPSDPGEKTQFDLDGKIPQSYLGDDGKYHSLVGITPAAQHISTIVDAYNNYQKDQQYHNYWKTMTDVAGSMLHNIADTEWLSSIGKVLDTSNGGSKVQNTISSLAGTVVPAGLRAYNQTYVDQTARDTRAPNTLEASLNTIKAGIPGLSQTLPARTDVLGRPVILQKGLDQTSTPDHDPVTQEMKRLSTTGKAVVTAAGKDWTGYTTDEDGDEIPKKVPFTPEQYHQYVQKSGDYILKDFAKSMADPSYAKMTEYQKLKELKTVITSQRANARDEVMGWNTPVAPAQSWSFTPPAQQSSWSFTPPKKARQ